MSFLVLLRHGKTTWNMEGRFTGQTDIPLSDNGVAEAVRAGETLRGIPIDCMHTSYLRRAIDTGEVVARIARGGVVPRVCYDDLNERSYGALEGRTHASAREEYGEDVVLAWRRGYRDTPPGGESLHDVFLRVERHFYEEIVPLLWRQQNVVVVAHHNSLRAMVMLLDSVSEGQISSLEIPTGKPWIYEMSGGRVVVGRRAL